MIGWLPQDAAGRGHIRVDLADQCIYTRKPQFLAQPLDEAEAQHFAVEIAGEIEQIRLDAALAVVEGGAHPHIDHRRVADAIAPRPTRIDPAGRCQVRSGGTATFAVGKPIVRPR